MKMRLNGLAATHSAEFRRLGAGGPGGRSRPEFV